MDTFIYFSIFFVPSFLVFIYKAFNWSGTKDKKGVFYFLYSEYISILIIIAVFAATLFITNNFLHDDDGELVEKTEKHYLKYNNFRGLEGLYTKKLMSDPLNLGLAYSKINYHFKQPKIVENTDGEWLGVRSDINLKKFFLQYKDEKDSDRLLVWKFSDYLQHYFKNKKKDAYHLYYDHDLSELPYVNYFMYLNSMTREYEHEQYFLWKEIENKGLVEESYSVLANLYIEHYDLDKAMSLLENPVSRAYISLSQQANIQYLNGNYFKFLELRYFLSYKNTTLAGFISALLILVIWFLFFYKLDVFQREKITLLLSTFLISVLLTEFCLLLYKYFEYNLHFQMNGEPLNDLLYCVFGIGFIEELIKLIPVLIILAFYKSEFDEPFDYILFFVMSALGFAFVENLMYFDEGVVVTMSGRAIFSSLGHMFFSATIAYGFVLAKFKYKGYLIPLVLMMFGFSILSHGLFDFLLFHQHQLIFVFFFLVMTKVFMRYINNALNNSPFFDYHIKMESRNLRQLLAVGLSLVFAFEHIYASSYYTAEYAQSVWKSPYIYSSVFVLIYIADHFSHFDLVKGQWAAFSFSFNTFNIHASEENFIDDEIDLIPKTKGQVLDQLASSGGFSGKITDRVSINYASVWMKDKHVKEDDWFVVQLDQAQKVDQRMVNQLLLNFSSKAVTLYHNEEKAYLMMMKDETLLSEENNKSNFVLIGMVDVKKRYTDE